MNQLLYPIPISIYPTLLLIAPRAPTSLNCNWKEWGGKKNSAPFGRDHCPLQDSVNFEIAPAEKKASDASGN